MICLTCKSLKSCTKLCKDMEKNLSSPYHKLTSNYKIKFVDPAIIEQTCSENMFPNKVFSSKITKILIGLLIKEIYKLPKISRQCIIMYYGLFGNQPMSQQKIAAKYKLSQNTVSYHICHSQKKIYASLVPYIIK